MYTNQNYIEFKNKAVDLESDEIKQIIKKIDNFYKKINIKFDRCVPRYQNAVKSILDSFPIKITTDINGKDIFLTNTSNRINTLSRITNCNSQLLDINQLVDALVKYIEKFKSIEYLDFLSEENRNVVFVGPNGCGKTTLLRKLKNDTKEANFAYYQADRVLLVNPNFNPPRDYDSFRKDMENNYLHAIDIDYTNQGYHISMQFDYFISLLEKERTEEKENCINDGITEKIIKKWHDLVKDRELFFEHGLNVKTLDGKKYSIKYLSSGEKSILFFLIGILLQEEKDIYFIDEPENNLNPAIVSKLWNFIERERPNSIFVYLTHDSDFVASRINAKIYWIEKYNGNEWNWKQLQENKDLPQDLMIQLVGNREPVIFCESNDEYKYDSKIFKMMFPEFKVVSAGGCDKVCSLIKAYQAVGLPQKAYGIIDCDYRDETYLDSLLKININYMPFFEIENFLFSKDILKSMIDRYSLKENKQEVFDEIKSKIRDKFSTDKEQWIAKHIAFELRNNFDYRGRINCLKTIEQFKELYNFERKSNDEINLTAQKYEKLHTDIMSKDEYDLYLRYLDFKGILSEYSSILNFKDGIKYDEEVMTFLNSDAGDILLNNYRNKFFPNIL